jgi:hypothetical protein
MPSEGERLQELLGLVRGVVTSSLMGQVPDQRSFQRRLEHLTPAHRVGLLDAAYRTLGAATGLVQFIRNLQGEVGIGGVDLVGSLGVDGQDNGNAEMRLSLVALGETLGLLRQVAVARERGTRQAFEGVRAQIRFMTPADIERMEQAALLVVNALGLITSNLEDISEDDDA